MLDAEHVERDLIRATSERLLRVERGTIARPLFHDRRDDLSRIPTPTQVAPFACFGVERSPTRVSTTGSGSAAIAAAAPARAFWISPVSVSSSGLLRFASLLDDAEQFIQPLPFLGHRELGSSVGSSSLSLLVVRRFARFFASSLFRRSIASVRILSSAESSAGDVADSPNSAANVATALPITTTARRISESVLAFPARLKLPIRFIAVD